jgi:hypothetical protein
MTDSQIRKDIDRWADDRLKQWMLDAMSRYQMMDIPEHDAIASLTATLMMLTANLLAMSTVSPEESGEIFTIAHQESQSLSGPPEGQIG